MSFWAAVIPAKEKRVAPLASEYWEPGVVDSPTPLDGLCGTNGTVIITVLFTAK